MHFIGNSSNYVSQLRRRTIIEALPADKAKLAKIRKQVCRRQIENASSELWRSGHQGSVRKGQYLGDLLEDSLQIRGETQTTV